MSRRDDGMEQMAWEITMNPSPVYGIYSIPQYNTPCPRKTCPSLLTPPLSFSSHGPVSLTPPH